MPTTLRTLAAPGLQRAARAPPDHYMTPAGPQQSPPAHTRTPACAHTHTHSSPVEPRRCLSCFVFHILSEAMCHPKPGFLAEPWAFSRFCHSEKPCKGHQSRSAGSWIPVSDMGKPNALGPTRVLGSDGPALTPCYVIVLVSCPPSAPFLSSVK